MREALKILPQKPDPIVIDQIAESLGSIGAIHHTPSRSIPHNLAKVLIILEVILIIWVVCGIIAAAIAGGKGRSGCGGFAIGFLLGPLGIIWALVMKTDQTKVDEKAVKSGR